MRTCEQCKAVIEIGAAFCPRCGRPLPAQDPADAASQAHRLLAEANLQRIRGNYDAAIDKCTEALQMKPNDPEVHSLLGDIYENQGKLEEASRWYQMAVDLRPDSAVDLAKLEQVRSRLDKAKRRKTEITTGSWAKTFLGQSRLDAAIRYIVAVCMVAVLILLIIGLLAWVRQGRRPVQPQRGGQMRGPAAQQPTIQTQPPAAAGTGADSLARPAVEQQLLSNLATNPAIASRRIIVEDVKSDPRRHVLIVSFRLRDAAAPLTRLGLLRDAAAVAAAAFTASADTAAVTVRILAPLPGKYGPREPHLVLVCDASRQISGLDANQATEQQLGQFLTDQWWGPEVAQ